MKREPVISRHRLPRFYRVGLAALWLTPIAIFVLISILQWGFTPTLLDPRFVLPLILMAVPALYVWHEGVDVLPSGIIRRIHVPHYYAYDSLETWYFDRRADRHVLTIWDTQNRKIVECRAGHLTDLPDLLDALKENVRYRYWPY
jgi:hypothetical protein